MTVVKNYPYPMDCPDRVFYPGFSPEPLPETSMGLVESGFSEDNGCFERFPWPDGKGPPNTGAGITTVWGDDGETVSSGSALLEGALSITRLKSSNRYWFGPPDPAWRLESSQPVIPTFEEDGFMQALSIFETGNPNADPASSVPYFLGPILPKGRGREMRRENQLLLHGQGTTNDTLVEWKRRRPYSWRL